MGRKKSISRDLAVEVFKRLMEAIDDPSLTDLADLPDSMLDVDEELGLGEVEEYLDLMPSRAAPAGTPTKKLSSCEIVSGTKPISIRIHRRVINAFKAEAIDKGTNYQTLMHRALADAAKEFAL
ncbi:MAG: hypothetical protein C0449_07890 [Polaromonas sp.]|nr:hypothetical protein [Polaromonas sp.]